MRPGSSRTPPTAKDWLGPNRKRGKERTGPDPTGPMCPSTPQAKRSPRPKSSWLPIRGPLTGLPTTPAFPGDQKPRGPPARLLPLPHTPPTPTGRKDSGGYLPGPEGNGPSGRQGSSRVLAPGLPPHLMETGRPPIEQVAPKGGGVTARRVALWRGSWKPERGSLRIVAGWPVRKFYVW